MCGIAGVLAFDRDLRRESDDVAERMSAALRRRGPDGEGTWRAEHVLLVFRRLAVIDLPGGAQPMVAEADGRELAVLDYTGEVFNFAELREELRGHGHAFRTKSDTEVVLRAYLQWGARCAERLVGMFAFAVWDARTEELVLIRDRFGIYPLFYRPTKDGVVFGSEPKAVLVHPEVAAVVDLDGMREALSFAPVPGRSVYQGLSEVLPGQAVTFSRAGVRTERYWQLAARPHADDLETTIRTVRELIEQSVSGQVVSDVPLCSTLSGGLDSSVVAALAARAMAAGGRRLPTFSVDFVGHLERFRPGELHGTPDTPYVREMVPWIDSDHTEVLLDAAELLDPANRKAVIDAMDMPAPGGEMYTSLYLLCAAARSRSTVTLSGDASDELFGGYIWFHDERYRRAQTFPWLVASHDMEMLTGLLDRGLAKALDVRGHQAAAYDDAVAEAPTLPGEPALDARIREITYLNITRYLRIILDRKDRMAMASGLEGRVPFCDHRLVEYVFNVPWSMRCFDGREKSLLRAAVRDLLPPSVLDRVKAPFPTTQDPAYAAGLRDQLRTIAEDATSPVHALLDRDRVTAALRGPAHGAQLGITRLSVDMAVQLHHWLTSSDLTLSL
ncbi:MAG: asparagine synthase (glutamine-hydrolyzing) [Frankiaceae bacterium]